MPADLTLPGDLPGLLRWCSPVRAANDTARIGVVVGTRVNCNAPDEDQYVNVLWTWEQLVEEDRARSSLALDLTDPTGCAHAAWWAAEQERSPDYRERMRRLHLLEAATWGRLTDARRRALRDLCLRLAEVARG